MKIHLCGSKPDEKLGVMAQKYLSTLTQKNKPVVSKTTKTSRDPR